LTHKTNKNSTFAPLFKKVIEKRETKDKLNLLSFSKWILREQNGLIGI